MAQTFSANIAKQGHIYKVLMERQNKHSKNLKFAA